MTNEQLYNECINENWFTAGTNRQYEKLFGCNETYNRMLEEGKITKADKNDKLANMIWICSEDVTAHTIWLILQDIDKSNDLYAKMKEKTKKERGL